MRFKTAVILAVFALLCASQAWSQDEEAPTDQFEIAANLTANLQGETSTAGVTDRATYSGGVLFNARYRLTEHLYAEANGGFTTYTQYYQPVAGQEQANIYEGTGGIVYEFRPLTQKLRPFVEVAGGVLYFSPVATGSTPGGSKAVQPMGAGGLGIDWKMSRSFSFRAGFRELIYRPPSFGVSAQTLNTFSQMAEPFIGLSLRF
ncbi:MAG TPA: hypothetical protein VN727_08700 [Candidatus Binatia bacterium]|nr:hypothetical protein [Candidatus Binatia bacterium]